ncbi:unnamed protein product, partial [Peniophora sp. CBMAI 1063]
MLAIQPFLAVHRITIDPSASQDSQDPNRMHRLALLIQLTTKEWNILHWEVLCDCLAGDASIASDLQALTGFHQAFHATSPSDSQSAVGKSVLVFPDFHLLSQQFIRVINAFRRVREP